MKIHSVNGKYSTLKDGKRAFFLNLKLAVVVGGKEEDLSLSAMYIDGKRIMCRGRGALPPKLMIAALNEAEGIMKAVKAKCVICRKPDGQCECANQENDRP